MNSTKRAHLFLSLGLVIALLAGYNFRSQWNEERLFPSATLTKVARLSDYNPHLKGSIGDTDVYTFMGSEPGGTLLLCGGTHPNEPAGYLAAVTMLENLHVKAGRVIIIARSNASGFTHNDSQEAMLQKYPVETPGGTRLFRNGSRFANPAHQWPDPTIYVNPKDPDWKEHHDLFCCQQSPCAVGNPGPGGGTLSGSDSRNLNRVYPGVADGMMVERIAFAIVNLIREEKVDLAIDYHEASLEYPTINVMVAHQRAMGLTSWAELTLADDEIAITTESSALRLRGLSHREWGDVTQALAVLFESANPAQGRLKGRTTVEQLTEGRDTAYARLQEIQRQLNERLAAEATRLEAQGITPKERSRKLLQIEIPEGGIPLGTRVGRHIQTTVRLVEAYNMEHPENEILLDTLPTYKEMVEQGIGHFIAGPKGERPAWRNALPADPG